LNHGLAEAWIIRSKSGITLYAPGKSDLLSETLNREVIPRLSSVEGLQWKKFHYNPEDGTRGSVFVWRNEQDWQA
jgi:hypothetical protein